MIEQAMVSIIVPAYNAEKYLVSSLNSALKQSYSNIEIICINDGSTDQTSEILNGISSQNPTVKVHHFPVNRGASAARNKGLELAQGEYVFFLDADDSLPENAIEYLQSAASKTGSELVLGQLKWLKNEARITNEDHTFAENDEAVTSTVKDSEYLQSVPGCHCCNLYRRQFLLQHDISYATDLTFGEDQLFQATAIVRAAKVTQINHIVYFYHHYRSGSLTQKQPSVANLLDDIEYQRRMALLFIDSGMRNAGHRLLKRWSYPIREYWLKMPGSLTPQEVTRVFSAFRNVAGEFGVTPWNESTPDRHRHLLKLILDGFDNQALEFLASGLTGRR